MTGRVASLAATVLAAARDHEKRVYSGEGIRADETIPFLRMVKELAVEVIRQEESQ